MDNKRVTNSNIPSQAPPFTNSSMSRLGLGSSTHTPEQQYHDHLVNEPLRFKAEHQDVVSKLNIKIAVLENELEHARKEKEAGLLGLRVVVESLTRNATFASAPTSTATPLPVAQVPATGADYTVGKSEFQDEIDRLRRENRSLKESNSKLERDVDELNYASDAGKNEALGLSTTTFRGLKNVPTGPRLQTLQYSGETSSSSMLVGSWDQEGSFGQEVPTMPNSPILGPTSSVSLPKLPSFDVGLNSLEDNLNDDSPQEFDLIQVSCYDEGFPKALIAPIAPAKDILKGPNQYPELEKGNNEQLGDKDGTLLVSRGPAPTVLRTGFQVGGNKRGDFDMHENAQLVQGTAFEIRKDISFDSTLWDSVEECEGAIETNMRLSRSSGARGEKFFPDLFRYGIQYKPAHTDSNYARTVHLSNLPADTNLREILTRVRGGEIIGATLLDTLKLTGGMTARVVFQVEAAAEDYVLYTATHPIAFGEEHKEATVTLIYTPTYPLNRRASQAAREQTRCLAIPEFPEDLSIGVLERALAQGNGYRAESLLEVWLDESGTLHLEFSSLAIAGSAYRILASRRLYGDCMPRFEHDPCAGPVEELDMDLPPRPPMLPRNRRVETAAPFFGSSELEEHGDLVVKQVEGMQRMKLAALTEQTKSSSWTDEVIDEVDEGNHESQAKSEGRHPATLLYENVKVSEQDEAAGKQSADFLAMGNVNRMMDDTKDKPLERQKLPTGLAGSKYASFVPDFEDRGERPRFGRGRGTTFYFVDGFKAISFRDNRSKKTGELEEINHQEDVKSDHAFNTFARTNKSDILAVQPPEATSLLDSNENYDSLRNNKISYSPNRVKPVKHRDLVTSSDTSKSRSPSPGLETGILFFHMSALDIATPNSSDECGATVKEVTATRTSNSESENKNSSFQPKMYPVHASTDNLVPQEVEIPEDLRDRKNSTFQVPSMDKMHSLLLNRRKVLGLGLSRENGIGGAKRKRGHGGDEDQENLPIGKDELLIDIETEGEVISGLVGTEGNDLGEMEEKGKTEEKDETEDNGVVINPYEISLDDEDDTE